MFEINKRMERLDREGRPIRVSLIGAGTQGTHVADSMGQAPGMEIDVICDHHLDHCLKAFERAGYNPANVEVCETLKDAELALASGKQVATTDMFIACDIGRVQVICEATGKANAYTQIGIRAINNKKHYITLNVEGDVCVGHIMSQWAKNAGVIYSGVYGDEPGCAMMEYYEAKALGFEVVAIGRSDQGGSDIRWNHESVLPVMRQHKVNYANKYMWASFLDGSKTNEECCMLANATGMRPDVRGMHRPYASFDEFVHKVPRLLDLKENGGILNRYGVVEAICVPGDPLVAASPNHIWEFVVVKCKTPTQKNKLLEMTGTLQGDLGLFYKTYHRGPMQAPITIAAAAIDNQRVIAPLEGKTRAADVCTMAKKDLAAGEVIDEIGGFCSVGQIECASVVRKEKLMPLALAAGARLKRDIPQGGFLTYDDVEFPQELPLINRVRALQDATFGDMY